MKRRKLPRGGEDIMKVLDISGPMTQKQILGSVDQPERTVRYGIRRLLEKGILKKMSNLSDMRSVYYYLDLDIRANFEFLASSKNEVEVSQTN
ncbi:MAG: ArsR family transcriptional regulator [Candidatus Heimdallarchaeaceae archaeon]|jgi:DNA-binding Lrp family transcriptional regulator